ncbi:hypothetical protein ACLB1E_03210 [Escherichia coli]
MAALSWMLQRDDFVARTRKEYETVRIQHGRNYARHPARSRWKRRAITTSLLTGRLTPPVAHRLGVQEESGGQTSKLCGRSSTGHRSL